MGKLLNIQGWIKKGERMCAFEVAELGFIFIFNACMVRSRLLFFVPLVVRARVPFQNLNS